MPRYRLLVLALIILLGIPASAKAAEPTPGLVASPAQIKLETSNKQPQKVTQVTVTNNYSSDVRLTAELYDVDENSSSLLPTKPLTTQLAESLRLSETDFTISPKSSKILTITATNTPSLSPGGHYASLVITQRSSDNQQLSLLSAININIFVIKQDGARSSVMLDRLQASNWLFHITDTAKLAFSNDGNVRNTPHASVLVTKQDGTIVAKGIANSGSQPLSPGKTVTDDIQLTHISGVNRPQKLLFTVSYRADTQDPITKTYSFWYIPPIYLLLIPSIIILLLIIIRVKKYKKPIAPKVTKKSRGRTHRVAVLSQGPDQTTIPVRKR